MADHREFNYRMYQYLYLPREIEKDIPLKKQLCYTKLRPCVTHQNKSCRHTTSKEILRLAGNRSVVYTQYAFSEDTAKFIKTSKKPDGKADKATKWGNLVMETDKDNGIECSRIMMDYFTNTLGIPCNCISLACSGGRSIHLEIAAEVFGYEPCTDLHKLQENIVSIMSEQTKTLEQWDMSIYGHSKRMFRGMNSYRPEHGTWKIPITPHELFTLPMEELLRISSMGPRKGLPEIIRPQAPVAYAREIMVEARKKISNNGKQKKEIHHSSGNRKQNIMNFTERPTCIQYLIENGSIDKKRNKSTIFHATYCLVSGMNIDEAIEEISQWHNNKVQSKHNEEELALQLNSVVESVYAGECYDFRCKYSVDELHLLCDAKCPQYLQQYKLKVVPARIQPVDTLTIEEARENMARTIKNCIETSGSYLLQTTPGIGKTTTTLGIATNYSKTTGKRFIYVHEFINQLEEFQRDGHLPPSNWHIIYARKQIMPLYAPGERRGNCFSANRINNLVRRLKYSPSKVIYNICGSCTYKDFCKVDENMYLGQWNSRKNLAMTHAMYALAVGPGKHDLDVFKAIIDEDIHEQVLEQKKVPLRTIQSDKDEHPLIKALINIIKELASQGINTHLTGAKLLSKMELHSNMTMEDMLSKPLADYKDGFQWKDDLYNILKEEQKYRKLYGNEYMSRIHLKYHEKHKDEENMHHLTIKFYFYNKRNLPAYDTIILDATTPLTVWQKIMNRQIQSYHFNVSQPAGMNVVQVINGKYGKVSHQDPKLLEKEETIISLLKNTAGENLFIAGWKGSNENIKRHFYNLRGTNMFQNDNVAIILGTPNIRTDIFQERTCALFYDEKPISFAREEEYRPYGMNKNGTDYAIKIPKAVDSRHSDMWSIYQEAELYQAINRIRPFIKHSSNIYLVTSLPVPGIVPTRLSTMSELTNTLKQEEAINSSNSTIDIDGYIRNRIWYYNKWCKEIDDIYLRASTLGTATVIKEYKTANNTQHNALNFDSFPKEIAEYIYNIAVLYTVQTGSTQGLDVRKEELYRSAWSNMSGSQKRYQFKKFVKDYQLKRKEYTSNCFYGNKVIVYYSGDALSIEDVIKDYKSFCENPIQK